MSNISNSDDLNNNNNNNSSTNSSPSKNQYEDFLSKANQDFKENNNNDDIIHNKNTVDDGSNELHILNDPKLDFLFNIINNDQNFYNNIKQDKIKKNIGRLNKVKQNLYFISESDCEFFTFLIKSQSININDKYKDEKELIQALGLDEKLLSIKDVIKLDLKEFFKNLKREDLHYFDRSYIKKVIELEQEINKIISNKDNCNNREFNYKFNYYKCYKIYIIGIRDTSNDVVYGVLTVSVET